MKKILLIVVIFLITISESCKRYEDGPWISFRSPIARLLGKSDDKIWIVKSYKVNDIEKIQEYNDSCGCVLTFVIYSTSGRQHDSAGEHELGIGKCTFAGGIIAFFDLIDNNKILYIERIRFNQDPKLDSMKITPTKYITPIFPIDSNIRVVLWNIKRLTNSELNIETNYKNNNYEVELYN